MTKPKLIQNNLWIALAVLIILTTNDIVNLKIYAIILCAGLLINDYANYFKQKDKEI